MNERLFNNMSTLLSNIDRISLNNKHRTRFAEIIHNIYQKEWSDKNVHDCVEYYELIKSSYNFSNPKLDLLTDILNIYINKEPKAYTDLMERVDRVLENINVD